MSRNIAVFIGSTCLLVAAACSSPAPDTSTYATSKKDTGSGGNADGTSFGTPGKDATSTPADALSACATQTAAATPKPVYLVFAYDQSGSMSGSNKWENAKAAMKGFFNGADSKGINASMTLFPIFNNQFCSASQYASPQVAMGALPSASFGDALDATGPDPNRRGTPTVAALSGAMTYAKSLQSTTAKDGSIAVVMVTDGIPEQCNDDSDIEQSVNVAKINAASIPTYVVGVGDKLTELNRLAAGGGTKAAFIVSTSNPSTTEAALTKAFNDIKLSAVSCDYAIPNAPPGQTFDRNKVNVQYTPPGSAAAPLDYNPTCINGTGWRYDDANSPGRVLACEQTCNTIKTSAGKVDIVFGCETRTGSVN